MNEYFEAVEKVSSLIDEYSAHDSVTDMLRQGHDKLVELARSKTIVKIASSHEEQKETEVI